MGGDFEEKSRVCLDCQQCKGKPPLLNESNSPEAVMKRVVGRIEQLIRQINSGQPFDWDSLDYYEWRLIEIWRDEENRRENEFKIQTRQMFEAMCRQNQG